MNVPRRPSLRALAMPAEHGGWGLTLEPGVLGLLAAPSLAGILLAVAALLAFVVRTPLRLLLIGSRRGRAQSGLPRSTAARQRDDLARQVVIVELAGLIVAVGGALLLAPGNGWWLAGLAATPLFVVALWFDGRSQSRHLVPEVAGSLAVASVAAMGARAGGEVWPVAIGLWLILGARILCSIPHVRAQVSRIHGRVPPRGPTIAGDVAALIVAALAVVVDRSLLLVAHPVSR